MKSANLAFDRVQFGPPVFRSAPSGPGGFPGGAKGRSAASWLAAAVTLGAALRFLA